MDMGKPDHEEWSTWPATTRESCQQMADKIEALMVRQQDFQHSMQVLRMEQESFLRDMRTLASADGQLLVRQPSVLNGHLLESDVAPSQAPKLSADTPQHVDSVLKKVCSKHDKPNLQQSRTLASQADDEYTSQRITMSTFHLMSQLSGLVNGHDQRRNSAHSTTSNFLDRLRALFRDLLRSTLFEPFMGFFIILNALNIGWTIEWELRDKDTSIQTTIEIGILAVFWAELFVLFFVQGCKALLVKWTLFDLLLNTVTTAALIFASFEEMSSFADAMKQMLILRMMRLLRLFRAVRLIQMSRSLWKLVEGMRHCMGTMVAALALICISLYVFGCFGAEMITKVYVGDGEVGRLIETNFSSLPRIMLTLFQFIAMDSTAAIYVQLVHRNPILFVYFIMLVVLITIMLMNLITAVVVEDAITTATMDHEMKRHFLREKLRKLRPAFVDLFNTLDVSNDGTVVIQEIIMAIQDGINIPPAIQDLVTPSRMLDLFDLLDQDNSGELTQSEFVDGLSCLALSEVPLETMQIMHLLRSVQREVCRLHKIRSGVLLGTPSRQLHSALRRGDSVGSHQDSGSGHPDNHVHWAEVSEGCDCPETPPGGAKHDGNGCQKGGLARSSAMFFDADGGFAPSDDGSAEDWITCDGASPGSDRVRTVI